MCWVQPAGVSLQLQPPDLLHVLCMLPQIYGEDGNEGQHKTAEMLQNFVARYLLRRVNMCLAEVSNVKAGNWTAFNN